MIGKDNSSVWMGACVCLCACVCVCFATMASWSMTWLARSSLLAWLLAELCVRFAQFLMRVCMWARLFVLPLGWHFDQAAAIVAPPASVASGAWRLVAAGLWLVPRRVNGLQCDRLLQRVHTCTHCRIGWCAV